LIANGTRLLQGPLGHVEPSGGRAPPVS